MQMSNYANNTRLNDAALLSKDEVRSVDPFDTLVCFVITGFRNLFKKKKRCVSQNANDGGINKRVILELFP